MINLNKNRAAEFLKQKIRKERQKAFSELDIQFMRAIESGDTQLQLEITIKKQALRDATNIDINSFETRDELIQLWPTDLLEKNPFPTGSVS
jgi:hypothetical protein